MSIADKIIDELHLLNSRLKKLHFDEPVAYIYNPLEYASEPLENYFRKYAVGGHKKILFLGMNPGPFGMMQTGVPFGEINAVKNWLEIDGVVKKPKTEHPKRPIQGFECAKSEVSGRRLWGLFNERYNKANSFFKHHFVVNYCPLGFLEAGGKNLTPDKLPKAEQQKLFHVCDLFLESLVHVLGSENLVGIGGFAHERLTKLFGDKKDYKISKILHPSPASPLANKNWAGNVTQTLIADGIWN
jgi:single-strand selective monofunctional uracil DNA glycosylase